MPRARVVCLCLNIFSPAQLYLYGEYREKGRERARECSYRDVQRATLRWSERTPTIGGESKSVTQIEASPSCYIAYTNVGQDARRQDTFLKLLPPLLSSKCADRSIVITATGREALDRDQTAAATFPHLLSVQHSPTLKA